MYINIWMNNLSGFKYNFDPVLFSCFFFPLYCTLLPCHTCPWLYANFNHEISQYPRYFRKRVLRYSSSVHLIPAQDVNCNGKRLGIITRVFISYLTAVQTVQWSICTCAQRVAAIRASQTERMLKQSHTHTHTSVSAAARRDWLNPSVVERDFRITSSVASISRAGSF